MILSLTLQRNLITIYTTCYNNKGLSSLLSKFIYVHNKIIRINSKNFLELRYTIDTQCVSYKGRTSV
jgi:hypothetical protein